MTTRNTEHLAATVAEHIKADAVFQGMYWDEEAQKGCFIGCLVHDNRPEFIEERYGIPVMITRIAEAIFERLPADEAKQFFADFPAAINNDGKDLSRVGWQFLAQTMRDLPVVAAEVQAVVDPVIAGLDRLAKGEEWPRAAAAAAAAARAAARAADAAAAAWAADARAAWDAAAAWAADARACDAAAWACDAAARACDATTWNADVAAANAATRAANAAACDADADAAAWAADANAAAAARAAARAADAAAAAWAAAAGWAADAAAKAGAWTAATRQQRDLLLRLIREA